MVDRRNHIHRGVSVVALSVLVVVWIGRRRRIAVPRGCFLRGNFFCGEETTTRSAGTAHGVFMARFMEIRLKKTNVRLKQRADNDTDLALTREAMDLFESGARYSPLKDAIVLLGIDIEWLVVNG